MVTDRKVEHYKHAYFWNDCNIHFIIEFQIILKNDEEILDFKKYLSKNFMKEERKKKILLNVGDGLRFFYLWLWMTFNHVLETFF